MQNQPGGRVLSQVEGTGTMEGAVCDQERGCKNKGECRSKLWVLGGGK